MITKHILNKTSLKIVSHTMPKADMFDLVALLGVDSMVFDEISEAQKHRDYFDTNVQFN